MVQKDSLKFKPVILIGGTTGVGKSDIAVKLAQQFNGEIISADSMQIYRGFNIGTAKITENEKQGMVHHLIDISDGREQYNVAMFKNDAVLLITEILNKGKLPIVVGGTGLYLNSLLFNYQFGGKSEYKKGTPQFNYFPIVLEKDRQEVYENIEKRVDKMISSGLVEEIKNLLSDGYSFSSIPFSAIGYKEFKPYFEDGCELESCIDLLKQHTRNYAKRQITWFKTWKDIALFCEPDIKLIINKVKEFLENGTR